LIFVVAGESDVLNMRNLSNSSQKAKRTPVLLILISLWTCVAFRASALDPATAGSQPAPAARVSAQVSAAAQFPAGIADILKMADAKVDAEVIKAYVHNSRVPYYLTANEIIELKNRGVSSDIITTILERGAELRSQASSSMRPAVSGPAAPPSDYGYDTQPSYAPYGYSYPAYYPDYGYGYGSFYDYGYGWPYYWPSFSLGFYPFGGHFRHGDFDRDRFGGRFRGHNFEAVRGFNAAGRTGSLGGNFGGLRAFGTVGRSGGSFGHSGGGFRSAGGFGGHFSGGHSFGGHSGGHR
jgi:hypothetical protein